jgi:hypothetical protein
MSTEAGWVYLALGGGYHKLGQTMNPKTRYAGQKYPFQVSIIHLIPVSNMDAAERALHAMFGHRRVHGEWYKLDDSDIKRIVELTSRDFGVNGMEQVTVRMPADLHAQLVQASEEDDRSLNSEIIALLKQALARRK